MFRSAFAAVQGWLARSLSSLLKELSFVLRKLSVWYRTHLFLQTRLLWLSGFRAVFWLQIWGRDTLLYTLMYGSPLMYPGAPQTLTPLPGTSSLSQAGQIAEPKAVPTCLSKGAFMADFLTNLGARIEHGSPSQISYLHFLSLLFCSPSQIVEYSHFILCL